MLFTNKASGKGPYNSLSEDFIPIACHYDENTLLTKNGELLQIFRIDGINSKKISKKLSNLRSNIKSSISNNVSGDKLAFWLHTIRHKVNLDDQSSYNNILSANIHELWQKENQWQDQFVNSLYITVVHAAPELKIKNFNSLIKSFFVNKIGNFEFQYLSDAVELLNKTVNNIIQDLQEYDIEKLKIKIEEDDICYSEMISLYKKIIHLEDKPCKLPIADLSKSLVSHHYAIGNDMIEVIGSEGKKFAALVSLKEYQELSSQGLDKFLQIPAEMIATEVFYFVDKSKIIPLFKGQGYIADIGGDKELKSLNGLEEILNETDNDENRFCHQQISFMVMGEDVKQLNKKVEQASKILSQIGIVHVREDINLEKTFWSQLPGNFAFLSRMSPTILDNTAVLTLLHNFPIGNQYNPWGKALTLLKTEEDTPYFMNLHDSAENSNCSIFGGKKSGKTTLLNFLLSEADKYKPTIIHIVDDSDSTIYVSAKGARWLNKSKNLFNPFHLDDSEQNKDFSFKFLKILAKYYFDPLTEEELKMLKDLSEKIFTIDPAARKLSYIITELIDGSSQTGQNLKKRFKEYISGGSYYEIFESQEELKISHGEILAINLEAFDDKNYQKKFFPKEEKLVKEYEYNLNTMRSVKAGIVYFLKNLLIKMDNVDSDTKKIKKAKIFAIDNITRILYLKFYSELIPEISEDIKNTGGVFINTVDSHNLEALYRNGQSLDWFDLMHTKMFLPSEVLISNVRKLFKLNPSEAQKLNQLTLNSRDFLLKQDEKFITVKLNLGSLQGLTKILSAKQLEIEEYKKILEEYPDKKAEDWLAPLYDKLEKLI